MARTILAVLLLAITTHAWAFRGGPVSNLHFDPVTGALAEQSAPALAAGPDGYLAAWFERGTVRAARIDAAGNAGRIRGRSISFEGMAGAQTFEIGPGSNAAVGWEVDHYEVFQFADDRWSRNPSVTGVVGEMTTILRDERFDHERMRGANLHYGPSLSRLRGEVGFIAVRHEELCILLPPASGCSLPWYAIISGGVSRPMEMGLFQKSAYFARAAATPPTRS